MEKERKSKESRGMKNRRKKGDGKERKEER